MKYVILSFVFLCFSNTFGKVSEKEFEFISEAIQSIYSDEIKNEVDELDFILSKDSQKKANAFAKRRKDKWEITVVSSLLDLKSVTPATLGMIMCHEMGHFMGGAPYVVGRPITSVLRGRAPRKMSCEGQADFFGSSDCFKKLVKRLPWILNVLKIYPALDEITKNCDGDETCKQLIYASYETVLTYQELLTQYGVHEGFQGHMDTLDSDRTLDFVGEYPSLECRFHTFVNGILCPSLNSNECVDMKWSRPACWY